MAKMTTLSGIEGLNRALRSLDKLVKAELTDASKALVGPLADEARSKAASLGGAWKYVGPTIKAEKSSKPSIKAGGNRLIKGRSGSKQTVGDLLYGAEFGALRFTQFRPWLGKTGYAIWPTVREHEDDIAEKYSAALLAALDRMA